MAKRKMMQWREGTAQVRLIVHGEDGRVAEYHGEKPIERDRQDAVADTLVAIMDYASKGLLAAVERAVVRFREKEKETP